MTTGTGLSAQFGMATESAYGTFVAPTRFLPITADGESIAETIEQIEVNELGPSIFRRATTYRTYKAGASGDVTFYVYHKKIGIVLYHCFGTVTTDQPDPTTKPNEYRHVFSPSTSGKRGLSATVQIGRPRRNDGTVVPHTYLGGKVTSFEFSCSAGEALQLQTSWDFASFDHTRTLASATYDDLVPLTFADASVVVNGLTLPIKEFSLSFDWSLETDAWTLGGTKAEPVLSDIPTIEGSFTTWYTSDLEPVLAAFRNGSVIGPLTLTAQWGEIDVGQGNPYKVVIDIPKLGVTGNPPQVGGPGPIEVEIQFVALADGGFAPVTVTYHTSDATP